eukprot:scaffold5610_cov237-Skeletonema_marinoi.AAC.1
MVVLIMTKSYTSSFFWRGFDATEWERSAAYFTSFQYASEYSIRSFDLGASPARHTSLTLTAAPFMIIMSTSVKINYNHSSVSLRAPSQNTLPWMQRIT